MSHYKPFSVFHAIDEWYRAWEAAQSNSGLLCLNLRDAKFCTLVSDLCSSKMGVLGKTSELLDTFKNDPECPKELLEFWKCEADQGCSHCWLSSRGPEHDECEAKMKKYWEAKEALIAYARKHHCFFTKGT